MTVKKGFVLRRVAGQTVAVAAGDLSRRFHGMVLLNESGRDLWQWLEQDCGEEELAEQLAARYDIPPDRARADVRAMLAQMAQAGLLEDR